VGLTATPVQFVSRNTFQIFQCDESNPTFEFSYEEAVERGYLAPFVVDTHTTPFLRDGIKYSQMTEVQRRQLDEDEAVPQAIEFEQVQVDKVIFNKDTNRHILRNLMDHGVKVGSRLGSTIIFARSHDHAILLQNLFDEMYPQYGGNFCRVIDHYDSRAEELIDDFKGDGNNADLTIAISVDMLDTGIDVPKLVNLVFAKPVYSFVKFWQMIGRGTRLCPNLFGPGVHKTEFQIFDHWGNFERFEQGYETADPTRAKSLMQQLFEVRLSLAQTAIEKQKPDAFDLAITLIGKDVASLPEKCVPVREKWKLVKTVRDEATLRQFDAATKATLQAEIAPLMEWCNIAGHEASYLFDRLIARLQIELLRDSNRFDDLKDELLDVLARLPVNLNQVRIKLPVIDRVRSAEFWDHVSVADLEGIRGELRGIMQYQRIDMPPSLPPKVVDITEDEALIERRRHPVKLVGLEMVAYRNRVQRVLLDIIDRSETLQKIKAGQPVAEPDLEALCSLVLTQDPSLDLHDLLEYYPETAGHLDQAIRGIIGMDGAAVQERFTRFVQTHPNLASHQIKFLDLVQNHISRYGSIEVDRLYDPPFTLLHSDGFDGLFDEPLADELLQIINSFQKS
ncbi:MAG: restriction endonuclease subunit R, partial [Planctomycetaceae bacterium]|nr:restriction endonuclease subunit R [Planctomycetaceae bacterium]